MLIKIRQPRSSSARHTVDEGRNERSLLARVNSVENEANVSNFYRDDDESAALYISRHGRTPLWLTGLLCSNSYCRWRSTALSCFKHRGRNRSVRSRSFVPNFLTWRARIYRKKRWRRPSGVPWSDLKGAGNVEDRGKCHILTGFRGSFRRYRVCKARKSALEHARFRDKLKDGEYRRRWAKKGAKRGGGSSMKGADACIEGRRGWTSA